MPRIVLTGGGTAGHVTPNLALIPWLQRDGWEVHYIGSYSGIERELVEPIPGVAFHPIASGKLRRYLDLKNMTDSFRVVKGTWQATGLLRKIKPDVIFSKGGFVSVPVVLGGKLCRVPVVIHESDRSSGLANRIAIPLCVKLCATFPEAAEDAGEKGIHTGPPIRPELFQGSVQTGRELCGFQSGLPVLLVMGGSMGAQAVNDMMDACIHRLLRMFQVVHIRGKENLNSALDGLAGYKQFEYVGEELPHLLALADVVCSRAGANAIWEFAALHKPLLLVPLPLSASRGDQIENARSFEKAGYARVLLQEEATPDTLCDSIRDTWAGREGLVRAQSASFAANGLDQLYKVILASAKKRPEAAAVSK